MKIANRVYFAALVLTLILGIAPFSASAQQTALDFASLGNGTNQGGRVSFSLGWRFTANKTLSITALGFYDYKLDGLSENHLVGIFDAQSCELFAVTTVTPNDPLTGFFRFHDISPVILPGGKDYYVAAVTGTELYSTNISSITVDPAITFWGSATYGNLSLSTTLVCPNGPGGVQGLKGNFGPNFRFQIASPTPTPTPTPQPIQAKRPSGIELVCKKIAQSSSSVCTATVSDLGAAPHKTPTGAVLFDSQPGSPDFSAYCFLSEMQGIAGAASCSVNYTPIAGASIGSVFPLDATYSGDSDFVPSTTEHKMIMSSCASSASNCAGVVSWEFADIPAIIKNALRMRISCGKTNSRAYYQRALDAPSASGMKNMPNGSCAVTSSLELPLVSMLAKLLEADWRALAAAIKTTDAKADPVLKQIKEIGELPSAQLALYVGNRAKIYSAIQKANSKFNTRSLAFEGLNVGSVDARAGIRDVRINLGTAQAYVKNGSQKVSTVRMNSRGKRYVEALKRADKARVEMTVKAAFNRRGSTRVRRLSTSQGIQIY